MNTAAEYLAYEATFPPYDQRTEDQKDLLSAAYKPLPMPEKRLVGRAHVEKYFVPENRAPTSKEVFSPSGRYKLVVTGYGTKPGCWSYARGEVFRVSDGQLVADVKRNYSSFPACWVEGHPNGHDYLVCGEDYQGQTVVELTTGRRRDELPDTAEKGFGFCWASASATQEKTLLLVAGCYWACPYEHRVYDFSDPMSGWPWVEVEEDADVSLDDGEHTTFDYQDGLFVYVEHSRSFKATGEREDDISSRRSNLWREKDKAQKRGDAEAVAEAERKLAELEAAYPDEDEDADKWALEPEHRVVLRREGDNLVVVEDWKSDHVVEQERKRKEWDEKWLADSRRFRAEDPFYRRVVEVVGSEEAARRRTHFTLPSINMRDGGDTNPAYFRVSVTEYAEDRRRTATLEWGVSYGDVVLELWTRGKGSEKLPPFPRTPEGFEAAWAAGTAHVEGGAA